MAFTNQPFVQSQDLERHRLRMDEQGLDPIPFKEFPREPLPFRVTRKKMWDAILSEFIAFTAKGEGKNAGKLADLGAWSDDRLRNLTPIIIPGTEITVEDGWVCGVPSADRKKIKIFRTESPALSAFNLMNGMTNLFEIADNLSRETKWNRVECFAYVRGLFLYLVLAGIVIPKELM